MSALETTLTAGEDVDHFKQDWFAYNGGAESPVRDPSKKPLFFNIALNYVELNADQPQEHTGVKLVAPTVKKEGLEPKHPQRVVKAKAEEISRPTTPEPARLLVRG